MRHRASQSVLTFALTVLLLTLVRTPAWAQDGDAPPVVRERSESYPANAVMINPLSLVVGAAVGIWSIRLDYERSLLPWMGITAQPSFMYWSFEDTEIVGGGLYVGLPFYPGSTAIRGFFVKPLVGFEYASGEVDTESGALGVFGIGATIGYTWQWEYGLIMSLEGGAAYPVLFGELADEVDLPIKVMPMLNYWIGWSF